MVSILQCLFWQPRGKASAVERVFISSSQIWSAFNSCNVHPYTGFCLQLDLALSLPYVSTGDKAEFSLLLIFPDVLALSFLIWNPSSRLIWHLEGTLSRSRRQKEMDNKYKEGLLSRGTNNSENITSHCFRTQGKAGDGTHSCLKL